MPSYYAMEWLTSADIIYALMPPAPKEGVTQKRCVHVCVDMYCMYKGHCSQYAYTTLRGLFKILVKSSKDD